MIHTQKKHICLVFGWDNLSGSSGSTWDSPKENSHGDQLATGGPLCETCENTMRNAYTQMRTMVLVYLPTFTPQITQ